MTLLDRARRLGWRRLAVAIPLVVLAGGVVVWSGLNLGHADRPNALWIPEDLPAVPAAADNGWAYLHEYQREIRGVRTEAIDRAIRTALPDDGFGPAPTERSIQAASDQLATERIARVWTLCDKAWAKPEFVDACPLDFSTQCPALELMQCHRLASFGVLQHVAQGQWNDAVRRADQLLERGTAHVRSARSLVSMAVALHNQRESLKLAAHLVEWASQAGEASRRELWQRRVEELESEDVDLAPAIIGEYLSEVRGVVMIQSGEIESEGRLPGFFFDAGATLTELNRIYAPAKMRAPAGAPAGARACPAIPGTPYAERFGWWVRNPLGKLYLDAVLPPRRVFEDLERARVQLLEAQARVRSQLEARGPARKLPPQHPPSHSPVP